MVWAIIAAGGTGKRLGHPAGKQYLKISGKPVLAYTLLPFQKSSIIDGIIVVVESEKIDYCRQEVIEKYNIDKVKRVIAGGKERQDSVFNGLKELPEDCQTVIIHDGARPMVTPELIEKSFKALSGCDGLVVGVPSRDTIKSVSGNIVIETIPRKKLWQIQTPQVFPRKLLIDAYEKARRDNLQATDDAAIMEKYGYKIKVVKGFYNNIKLTTPEDLKLVKTLIEEKIDESGNRI